jgi:hypothetical protein
MKTLSQLSVVKEVSSAHPFGAIINETDTNDGTPVIRELYNDHLVNHYKLLEEVGMVPNGNEDSEVAGYQILEAFKKLPNSLNDIERVLNLTGSVWSVDLPLEILPNKYFFIARASENYSTGANYTFKGIGATTYPFSSSGFKSSDEVLVIIDGSGVRAYSLSFLETVSDEIFTVMGLPVAFNDGSKMFYQSDGKLLSDVPTVDYLETIIRTNLLDGTILLNDMIVSSGYVLCFCVYPNTNTYFFRQFDLVDLTISQAVTINGASFSNASDFSPYLYAKKDTIYITNGMNSTANNYSITKLLYEPLLDKLTFVSNSSLDVSFEKTSNAVVKDDFLFTLDNIGTLNKFNLNSGAKTLVGYFGGIAGNLFGYNGSIYFSAGQVAKKWNL